ncbi:RHS repeat domain-containing protein, partial [Tahibacter harae]
GTPRVYTYDARDRMKALSLGNGTTLHFTYHADGLRREKTDGSTTTRYQYDGQSLLAETNTIGNTLKLYHYSAEQLLAETKAGTTPQRRQYLLDALRSPIALLTAEGAVSARTSYDAFGEVRAQLGTNGTLVTPDRDAANAELPVTDGQAVGFTGYLKDTESGLYYAKARYYDPATARFNTEDPEAGKDLEPPSLHRYLYAYANPTVYLDSDGRQACRGHEVENCPLPQWTSPNRPIPQTTARNALRGDPHLTEVNADRAFALPTVSLTPDEHINTELYRLVPHVDPKDDNKAVRFYSAQNRETGQFDWTVPPDALDYFVKHESYQMNMAAYSRTMGGATPSNIEVQRAHREIASGNITGAMSHLTSSWGAALKDPLFYLTALGGMTAGSAAKAVEPARAITIAEGGGSRPVVRRTAADFAGHADSEAGGAPSPFRRVTPTKDRDEGAQAFAKKHGGQASVNIEGFSNREFDMVSDQYVGQAFGPMKQGQRRRLKSTRRTS